MPATAAEPAIAEFVTQLTYDDLSWGMDGHPSVTLVPPLPALVPEADPSGRDVIAAFAAGFETECAVAEPISPAHYEAGWHATATFGSSVQLQPPLTCSGCPPRKSRRH
jgi:2-methylcitrate dehydratase PrpD